MGFVTEGSDGPPKPTVQDSTAPWQRVLGDFRLTREIARSPGGSVFVACQGSLDRDVAVKVLPAHDTRTQAQIDRFLCGAHALARLRHPSIVSVHAIGLQRGSYWVAMDFIRGRSLDEELRVLRGEGPKGERSILPEPAGAEYLPAVARLVRGLAEALDHVHGQGLVHRTVGPRSVLLDRDGMPHLIGFGLSLDRPHADPREDVFGLGAVLCELLARRARSHLPRQLATICSKALAACPEARYATAAEVEADLRRYVAREAIVAQPPSLFDRARRWASTHGVGRPHSRRMRVGT